MVYSTSAQNRLICGLKNHEMAYHYLWNQKKTMRKYLIILFLSAITLCLHPIPTQAQNTIGEICPDIPLQNRWEGFDNASGVILTSFDGYSMWAYDVTRNVRYALEGVPACGTNCHLSPDGAWITYLRVTRGDFIRTAYGKMRLNGSERTQLVESVAEIEWWSDTALLVWDRNHSEAYLQSENGWRFATLDVRGVTTIQPEGYWGLYIRADGDTFYRSVVDLRTRNRPTAEWKATDLGENIRYFNTGAWSSDGKQYAYVAPMPQADDAFSGEIFLFEPTTQAITQATLFTEIYGNVRINGLAPNELSWSPDNTKIAFWVIPLGEESAEEPTQNGLLHILDVQTGKITYYCGYQSVINTPNPPKLRWSPDGTYIAFGGNPPEDDRGALLMALHTETGVVHVLSVGLASTFGNTDAIAWGILP